MEKEEAKDIKQKKETKDTKSKILEILLLVLIVVTFIMTIASMIYFKKQVNDGVSFVEGQYREYDRHYVLIPRDMEDTFFEEAYSSMKEVGELTGVYVEKLGDDLAIDLSNMELLKIAIDSHVDGIIFEADDSMDTVALISKATAEGIPVITVKNDSVVSARRSFVGISYYNLGTEYGKQILSAVKHNKYKSIDENGEPYINVFVLIDGETNDTSQNVTVTALKEQLQKKPESYPEIVVNTIEIDNSGDFSAEESIRDLFQKPTLPDVIVCLNEVNTISAYQTIVEQNRVGESIIMGYSDSEVILKAIEKDIVYATITLDGKQLGRDCVEALNEYIDYGRVSEYYGVDFNVINRKNIVEYLKGDSNGH